MPATNLQVRKNVDLVILVTSPITGITEVAFKMQQGITSATGALGDSRISLVGQNEIKIVIPRSALTGFVVGPAQYDIVLKRGGVVETVQFGSVSVVEGYAAVS